MAEMACSHPIVEWKKKDNKIVKVCTKCGKEVK